MYRCLELTHTHIHTLSTHDYSCMLNLWLAAVDVDCGAGITAPVITIYNDICVSGGQTESRMCVSAGGITAVCVI